MNVESVFFKFAGLPRSGQRIVQERIRRGMPVFAEAGGMFDDALGAYNRADVDRYAAGMQNRARVGPAREYALNTGNTQMLSNIESNWIGPHRNAPTPASPAGPALQERVQSFKGYKNTGMDPRSAARAAQSTSPAAAPGSLTNALTDISPQRQQALAWGAGGLAAGAGLHAMLGGPSAPAQQTMPQQTQAPQYRYASVFSKYAGIPQAAKREAKKLRRSGQGDQIQKVLQDRFGLAGRDIEKHVGGQQVAQQIGQAREALPPWIQSPLTRDTLLAPQTEKMIAPLRDTPVDYAPGPTLSNRVQEFKKNKPRAAPAPTAAAESAAQAAPAAKAAPTEPASNFSFGRQVALPLAAGVGLFGAGYGIGQQSESPYEEKPLRKVAALPSYYKRQLRNARRANVPAAGSSVARMADSDVLRSINLPQELGTRATNHIAGQRFSEQIAKAQSKGVMKPDMFEDVMNQRGDALDISARRAERAQQSAQAPLDARLQAYKAQKAQNVPAPVASAPTVGPELQQRLDSFKAQKAQSAAPATPTGAALQERVDALKSTPPPAQAAPAASVPPPAHAAPPASMPPPANPGTGAQPPPPAAPGPALRNRVAPWAVGAGVAGLGAGYMMGHPSQNQQKTAGLPRYLQGIADEMATHMPDSQEDVVRKALGRQYSPAIMQQLTDHVGGAATGQQLGHMQKLVGDLPDLQPSINKMKENINRSAQIRSVGRVRETPAAGPALQERLQAFKAQKAGPAAAAAPAAKPSFLGKLKNPYVAAGLGAGALGVGYGLYRNSQDDAYA
jgi:hypothetical protein